MNTRFISSIFSVLLVSIIVIGVNAQPVLWPINPNEDPQNPNDPNDGQQWNTVNCSFGEIHPTGTDHFHGAIDIDCHTGVPVKSVESGVVLPHNNNPPDPLGQRGIGASYIVIQHNPMENGLYIRRTKYLHIHPNTQGNLVEGGAIVAQTHLGKATNHLHFEMYQRENGVWYKINPLHNDFGWQLRYHQELDARPDRYDPQVNDIIVQPKTGITDPNLAPNNVASGCAIIQNTAGGLSHPTYNGVQYPDHVKAHLADTTPVSNLSAGPIFRYPDDKLSVFGNIGFIANVRDVGINALPSSGSGLTVKQLSYRIENQAYQINVPIKYDIDFERLSLANDNAINQIFHTDFNSPIVGDPDLPSSSNRYVGNHDFMELRSGDDTYLSPYPNALVGQVQSNGIWFTKARADTEHVFRYTPDNQHIARCNAPGEAKYPDGDYTLRFFAQDDWGRINRAVNAADVNAKVTVIVDNFRPFVQQVELRSGDRSTQSI